MCLNQLSAGSGNCASGSDGCIEVYLAQQQNTSLANLSRLANVMIGTHAVAAVTTSGYDCVGALSKAASKAINFSGNSCVCLGTAAGSCNSTCTATCGVFSNSDAQNSINFQGSTTLTATAFQAVGNYNLNGNALTLNAPTKLTDAAPVTDPYSCSPPQIGCAGTITWPSVSGSEITAPSSGTTLTPGTYNGPMQFTSGTTVICPGVYIIDGEDTSSRAAFEVSSGATVQMGTAGSGGCPANGINGVTIIATCSGTNCSTGGGFQISSKATVTLSAPNSSPETGIPSGLLFAQNPNTADTKTNGKEADSRIVANSNSALKGLLYTPATNLTFQGNSNSTCFLAIAQTVTFNGDSTMSGSQPACQLAGVTGPTVTSIALTQ